MRKGGRGRRDSSNKALVRGLVLPLLEKGSIQTTAARARLIREVTDDLVLKIKDDTLNSRRAVISALAIDGSRASKLFDRLKGRVDSRTSGFVRSLKMGRRLGDNAPLVKLELIVNEPDGKKQTTKKEIAGAE